MDKLIYTAMTGASATLGRQAAVAHNLANVSTHGYRAEEHRLRAVQVQTHNSLPAALPTRVAADCRSLGVELEHATCQLRRRLAAARRLAP